MRALILLLSAALWLSAESRMLVDRAGREVIVPADVRHVATVGGTPALNSFIYLFGKADTLVNGAEPPLSKMPFWKHQQWFDPKVLSRPQVSRNPPDWTPDFEKLSTLHVDVALVNDTLAADVLQKRGYTFAVINWQGERSIDQSVAFLGQLFGMQERVVRYRAWEKSIRERIDQAMAEYQGERSSALYLRLGQLNLPMVSTANTMIRDAGGTAVAAQVPMEHVNITLEQLYAWNPDVLFVWSAQDVALAYREPKFALLKAVQNKAVYIVPMGAHFWTHYTPEQPLGRLWMATKLYPERFADVDVRREARLFYEHFMGVRLSEAQLDSVFALQP
ncbi:MAG: ABC transporter substrate-binding protein [Campylobacterales bacterium]|nr:ABC transporter substrate-binding protein [Campylobacterales bacterium]